MQGANVCLRIISKPKKVVVELIAGIIIHTRTCLEDSNNFYYCR